MKIKQGTEWKGVIKGSKTCTKSVGGKKKQLSKSILCAFIVCRYNVKLCNIYGYK